MFIERKASDFVFNKEPIIAAERASLKRASEAADLICVCRGEFISNHVYRRALWSCAFGNAQNTLLTCVSSPIMSCVQKISCFRLAV